MARKAAQYAQALLEALSKVREAEQGTVVHRFKEQVVKRGDIKLFGSIVKEFEKRWESRNGTMACVVTPAQSQVKKKVKEELRSQGYTVKEEVQEQLIGGVAVFLGNDYLIDNSMRGRLRQLQSRLLK